MLLRTILRTEQIARQDFESHKIGSEDQLMNLQKSPPDELGVKLLNILYNYTSRRRILSS